MQRITKCTCKLAHFIQYKGLKFRNSFCSILFSTFINNRFHIFDRNPFGDYAISESIAKRAIKTIGINGIQRIVMTTPCKILSSIPCVAAIFAFLRFFAPS